MVLYVITSNEKVLFISLKSAMTNKYKEIKVSTARPTSSLVSLSLSLSFCSKQKFTLNNVYK